METGTISSEIKADIDETTVGNLETNSPVTPAAGPQLHLLYYLCCFQPTPDNSLTAPTRPTPDHPQSTHLDPPARRLDRSTPGPPLQLRARVQTRTYQMEGGHVSGPQSPAEARERNPSRPGFQEGQEKSRPP